MTADTLEPTLRATGLAVRLVSERHLLKVLHHLRERDAVIPANADMPVWVGRPELVDAAVLPHGLLDGSEPRLLLITAPTDRMIDHLPADELLRAYWRLLFQGAVMAAIDRKFADGALTLAACKERLARLGPAAEREVRYVLEADHLADPEADAAARYRAFAAVYLDLRHFAPAAITDVFPSLPGHDAVPEILAQDVEARELLLRSRPAGSADLPPDLPPDAVWADTGTAESLALGSPSGPQTGAAGDLLRRADAEESRGNFVRAGILRMQAAASLPLGADRDQAVLAARAAIGKLVAGLAKVLDWDEPTQQEWWQALIPLLGPAAEGIWPRAARCLYELQKIPGELAREVYAVDLVEVIRTLGHRPLKRVLPHARPVRLLVRLKAAQAQLLRSAVGERGTLRLDRLLHHEIHRGEHTIRHTLGPVITAALSEAGLRPENRIEEVGRDKAVAELLDRVCDQGYLRIGDLRDAIARNQLKMPDLSGPGEWLTGDPLLKADTRLTYALDGVYRRGEFYLRWLQRFSSLFFGTRLGRALALYLIGPFLGAFMMVVFVQEMHELGGKAVGLVARHLGGSRAAPPAAQTPAALPAPVIAPAPKPKPAPVPNPAAPAGEEEPGWHLDPEGNVIWEDEPKPPGHGPLAWTEPEAQTFLTEFFTSTASTPTKHGATAHKELTVNWKVVGGLAAFLFLVFHVPPFRRAIVSGLVQLLRMLKWLFHELPLAVWRAPAVKAIRHSLVVRFLHRHLWAPMVLSALCLLILFVVGVRVGLWLRWGWVIPVALILLYNTPWGWVVQDRLAETLADWWRRVRIGLLLGLMRWFLYVFQLLANWVERRLYAVDEWLRYREGDSDGSLTLKAVLGLIWFPFAYITRFAFNLLLEPQINPVKHFPVVTVSHKVITPTFPTVAEALNVSHGTALGILACVPGVFGFTAWELMANWKLYRANRPARMRAATIGSHGETMRGLLRPGFHSGTVPKDYRRLRKDVRWSEEHAAARHHHDLEHVAEGVHRFAERELVPLLTGSPDWGGVRLGVAAVRLGCQRAVVELEAPELGHDPFAVAFENRDGRIEATVEQAGWVDKLTDRQRAVFLAAVRGLLDRAATDRFNGQDRHSDANTSQPPATGPYAELAKSYTWLEWIARWGAATGEGEGKANPGAR